MTGHGAASVGLLLSAFALLVGCADPLAGRTAALAGAAAPALTTVHGGYALVQTVHGAAIFATSVAAFDHTSIDAMPARFDFGAPDDLRVREQVLTLLRGYVALLGAVSGHQKADPAKDEGAVAGKAAADTLSMPGDVKAPPKLSNTQLQQAAQAIQTVEQLLVARARRRALPHILAQADRPISRICTSLRADFADPDTPGLRSQVRADYELRLTLANDAIRDHPKAYSYPEREHAIESLFALMRQEQQADAALARTEDALADLAATHHALLLSIGHSHDKEFDKQLGRLALDSGELTALEQQLGVAAPPAAGRGTP